MNLNALVNYYLPEENVDKMKSQLFTALYEILSNPDLSEANKYSIIDGIIASASDKSEIRALLGWLEEGKITSEEKQEF